MKPEKVLKTFNEYRRRYGLWVEPDEQMVCSYCGEPLRWEDLVDDCCPKCGSSDIHNLYPEV